MTSSTPGGTPKARNNRPLIGADAFPELGPELALIGRGRPVAVARAVQRPVADGTVIEGTVNLPGFRGAAISAVVGGPVAGTRQLAATITAAIAPGDTWKFTTAYPTLAAFPIPGVLAAAVAGGSQGHLLDALQVTAVTSAIGADADGQPGAAGLRLTGRCRPGGLLAPLGALLPGLADRPFTAQVVPHRPMPPTLPDIGGRRGRRPDLRYPWEHPEPLPGLTLAVDLGGDTRIGALRLDEATLHVYCPLSRTRTDWPHAPSFGVSLRLTIEPPPQSGGEPITARLTLIGLESGGPFLLTGRLENVTIPNLLALSPLVGVDDLSSALPASLRDKLRHLSLAHLSLCFDRNLSILSAGAAVRLDKVEEWTLPGFPVRSLTAHVAVSAPFDAAKRRVDVELDGLIVVDAVEIEASISLPESVATASLVQPARLPLASLFARAGLPLPAGFSDPMVDCLDLEVAGNGGFALSAVVAQSEAWTIPIGPRTLAIRDLRVGLVKAARTQAMIAGTLDFDGLALSVSCNLPGDLSIGTTLPTFSLTRMIEQVASLASLNLPKSVPDISLTDTRLRLEKEGSAYRLTAATTIDKLGTLFFVTQRDRSGWGVAVGISLPNGLNDAIAAWSFLKPLDEINRRIGLRKAVVLLTSLSPGAVRFPDQHLFQLPQAGPPIQVPAVAGGDAPGLYLYAEFTGTSDPGLQVLDRWIRGNGCRELGVIAGISLPNPARETSVGLVVSRVAINPTTHLSGRFGLRLKNGNPELYLDATVATVINGRGIEFAVGVAAMGTGLMAYGSAKGTLTFGEVEVTHPALMIGINSGGVGSFGLNGILNFSHRLAIGAAILVDSTNPMNSMVAGTLPDMTLTRLVTDLTRAAVPFGFDVILDRFKVDSVTVDTGAPAELWDALAAKDTPRALRLLGQRGLRDLPVEEKDALLIPDPDRKVWYIYSLVGGQSYAVFKERSGVRIAKSPQVYIVPQATRIGQHRYEAGVRVAGRLYHPVFGIPADVDIDIAMSNGIAASVHVARITVISDTFFSIRDPRSNGGPFLSIATYHRPHHHNPDHRGPHADIAGVLTILGLQFTRIDAKLTANGLRFEASQRLPPLITVTVEGTYEGGNALRAGGTLSYGIDITVFGKRVTVMGTGGLAMGIRRGAPFAELTLRYNILNLVEPSIRIPLETDGLTDLPGLIRREIEGAASKLNPISYLPKPPKIELPSLPKLRFRRPRF